MLAVLLALVELVVRRRIAAGDAGRDVGELTWRDAIVVGFAQAAALVPGTSRSGATIFGGLCCGLSREAAARFSFLLSIPSMLLAGLYQLVDARAELLASQSQVVNLVVALVVSAAVGYATIPWLLGFLRTHSTFVFIVYRLVLAGVLVGLLTTGRLAATDGVAGVEVRPSPQQCDGTGGSLTLDRQPPSRIQARLGGSLALPFSSPSPALLRLR